MTEYIRENGDILAIIVPSSDEADRISFFTDEESSQQLGLMNRPEGHKVEPHIHPERERTINGADEVLFVRQGKVKIDIIGEELSEQRILEDGDVILLRGGHSVEMIEESEIVAVKQGPYREDEKQQL